MGVVDGLTRGRSDVGADVHSITTGLIHDAIHLLVEEDPECVKIVTITSGEIGRMSLWDDQSVTRCHGIEIFDGEVMHVLPARSRVTSIRMPDQMTKSTIQFYE